MDPTVPDQPCYLVVFGRCEIEHFRNRSSLNEFMRSNLIEAGVDVAELPSIDDLDDAFITLVHEACEGPLEWGEIAFDSAPPDAGGGAHAPERHPVAIEACDLEEAERSTSRCR